MAKNNKITSELKKYLFIPDSPLMASSRLETFAFYHLYPSFLMCYSLHNDTRMAAYQRI